MNRLQNLRRRRIIKRATTVLLFASLLAGTTGFSMESKTENATQQAVVSVEKSQALLTEKATNQNLIKTKAEEQLVKQTKSSVVAASLHATPKVEPTKNVQLENRGEEKRRERKQDGFVYNASIPMPKAHQAYLYKLCKERGIDYDKALAVIKHESGFDPNAVNSTNDYGYFQVNIKNHKALANDLKTPNAPLDPYVNINWGTSKLWFLTNYWKEKGVKGKQLDDYVWSSYHLGLGGFKDQGVKDEYVSKVRNALDEVKAIS